MVAQKGMYGNNTAPLYFVYTLPPAMTGSAIHNSSQSYDQRNRPDVLDQLHERGRQAVR